MTDTEYKSILIHIQDLRETVQAMERQMRDIRDPARQELDMVFALSHTVHRFDERLEELEVMMGV